MAPLHRVVDACKDNNATKLDLISCLSNGSHQTSGTYDDNIPVERLRSQLMRRLREEIHDEAQNHEENRDNVDWQSPLTQAPAAWKQWLATETLENDTTDRDDVRAEEGARPERGDDVQRYCATQINEREKHAEDVGRSDGVQRDVAARLNMGESARERCTAITSL